MLASQPFCCAPSRKLLNAKERFAHPFVSEGVHDSQRFFVACRLDCPEPTHRSRPRAMCGYFAGSQPLSLTPFMRAMSFHKFIAECGDNHAGARLQVSMILWVGR